MQSRKRHDIEYQDHDSFLDIVANIVGILIILVLVVSVRAKDAPVKSTMPDLPEIDLQTPSANAAALKHDLYRLAEEKQNLDQLLAARQHERQLMANTLAAAEDQVQLRRQSLDQQQQEDFDLRQELNAARNRLEKIELQRVHAVATDPEVVEVESLPTPLSETVFGKEIHFQLRGGQVVHLPIDALFDEAKAQAREKTWKLDDHLEATEVVGPIRGFRMRYTLEKVELPLAVRLETGRTGHMIRARRWELIPTESHLGESLEVAMAEGSRFQQVLRGSPPKDTTITIWTYPDSFAQFRELKKELFHRGYATASRPLPDGIPIAGSPEGSRSSAQ